MTIDIRITTLDPTQYGPESEQLEEALRAIGFVRAASASKNDSVDEMVADAWLRAKKGYGVVVTTGEADAPAEAKPVRERGKPAPGRARRTKEEIAEDEAADKAEFQRYAAGPASDDQTVTLSNISATPEDRVGPENPADAAQDEADEAAEAEASAGPITLDDIRKVVGEYQRDFGMDAATKDLPPVWRKICGEDCTKLSMIPEDKLAEVHAAIRAAHQKAGK